MLTTDPFPVGVTPAAPTFPTIGVPALFVNTSSATNFSTVLLPVAPPESSYLI